MSRNSKREDSVFQKGEQSSLDIIRYPAFDLLENVLGFTSTRKGGVSSGNYNSLNLGLYSGDNSENIETNFTLLCGEIGLQRHQLHIPYQTHENSVLCIDEEFLTQDVETRTNRLRGVDALITNRPNQCICVTTADCVPILLCDPIKRVVATIHAGWRGTCSRIPFHVIQAVVSTYGSSVADIIAVMGPSISLAVYEVGDELIDAFEKEGFKTTQFFRFKNGKPYLDLWEANKHTLLECGIPESNIHLSSFCTYTDQERFFSARRLGIKSGRLLSGMMLK
ncbi:MAG: peptidoglycan editing factor PgeF [Paludibacteraceae bacterium]